MASTTASSGDEHRNHADNDQTSPTPSVGTAFGAPGIQPRWTQGNKDGAGTAYAASSRIWFTLWNGVVTEVYYPTVDRPQLRDLQFLITDGESFFHEEKRHLDSVTERPWQNALAYRITNSDPEGRYKIIKDVISDPHLPCVLQHVRLEGDEAFLKTLHLYALCAPHLCGGGWGNTAHVTEIAGRVMLTAEKDGAWLAMAATVPYSRLSCGYSGHSDGWNDLNDDFQMDWQFAAAPDGNVALTGELDLTGRDGSDFTTEFTLGLAFGDGLHSAVTSLLQSLDVPFDQQCRRFQEQWARSCSHRLPLEEASSDEGRLYSSSYSLLLAHEDKTYPGAMIASLSVPWGEARGDDEEQGYHLVWTRDLVQSVTGLLAAGHTETPWRALVYLAVSQEEDGGFPQNFWLNGEPNWVNIQLDEVAFPVLLAWRLYREQALRTFDPYPMVRRAARYLIEQGPETPQERWEENSGLSPSTLAATITALIVAAVMTRERGDDNTARFLEEYADFLEQHIEAWTVTTEGTLVEGISRYYMRIKPADTDDPIPEENPNAGVLPIRNRAPDAQQEFEAKNVVDTGFLELVRYGIRRADDPLITDTLKVVDEVLKVETPAGPCWHRYNHDGYGQRDDGGPFVDWGVGRAWPLLTGERGHYEIAAGHDATPYISALENFASATGMLPEQVWDSDDLPAKHMFRGRPTGSAMPLMWAHSEYIKLLRSARDGQVFDLIPEIVERYTNGEGGQRPRWEVWKINRQVSRIAPGCTLRIQAPAHFRLHWSRDDWNQTRDDDSKPTALGLEYFDIEVPADQHTPLHFTFYWPGEDRWEGRDYQVEVE